MYSAVYTFIIAMHFFMSTIQMIGIVHFYIEQTCMYFVDNRNTSVIESNIQKHM